MEYVLTALMFIFCALFFFAFCGMIASLFHEPPLVCEEKWSVASFCYNCNAGPYEAAHGNAWFTNKRHPCCPKCGTKDAFITRTCKKIGNEMIFWDETQS